MSRRLMYFALLIAAFGLAGCTESDPAAPKQGKHPATAYEAAARYVTFPYRLPYFEDYSITTMYYTPPNEAHGIEESLFLAYNSDLFITPAMREAIIERPAQLDYTMQPDGGQTIYGPFHEADTIVLPIHVMMKRSPFEVVSPDRDRSELDPMTIDGREVVYAYRDDAMSGDGRYAYYVFEAEHEGTYFRVYVEFTTKMTEEEVEERVSALSQAIFTHE